MNEIKVFENPEFGEIRTMEIDGKPYFAGSDVATALGYQNPSRDVQRHCKNVVKRRGTDSARIYATILRTMPSIVRMEVTMPDRTPYLEAIIC